MSVPMLLEGAAKWHMIHLRKGAYVYLRSGMSTVGYVRRVAPKTWKCEHYHSNGQHNAPSLYEGKLWVERRFLLTGK
jgi:hypothetical protein